MKVLSVLKESSVDWQLRKLCLGPKPEAMMGQKVRGVQLIWILHGGILMLISSHGWGLIQDDHGWRFCGFGWSG